MISKEINLGEYKYLCRFYKYGEDFNDINVKSQYIVLRNFEIYNDVVYDRDIYFIDKSILNDEAGEICFPIKNNQNLSFTNNYEYFSKYGLSSFKDFSYDLMQDDNVAWIPCDKVRIYNPTIKKDLDFIIYFDNYINDIHFHYFCRPNSVFTRHYDEEINLGKMRYIEYIEFKIPSTKYLFDKDNKIYFNDDFNKIININDDEGIENAVDFFNSSKSFQESNVVYLSSLINPYFLKSSTEEDGSTRFTKVYINSNHVFLNENFYNFTLNLTLYPYSMLYNDIYFQDQDINPINEFITDKMFFNLSSYIGFDNGKISLMNEFKFPGKIEFNEIRKYDETIDGELGDSLSRQVTRFYNTYYIQNNLDNYEHDEYLEELDIPEIRVTGYYIQFATDFAFKEIVYESKINTDNQNDNFIYDFSFSLDGLVNSWSQLNDILVVRSMFIDKRLNVIIYGNIVVLNKEWFKYMVNESSSNLVYFKNQNNLIETNFMDVNQGYNMIDKIKCNVIEDDRTLLAANLKNIAMDYVKLAESNSLSNQNLIDLFKTKLDKWADNVISLANGNNVVAQSYSAQNSNITKIIYKPIFYKVQDLQMIRLRQQISQNIGINLGSYFTKVDLFMINIDGMTIKESSRNDVFVIFNIDASKIENPTGIYNIFNENFEFISSGSYMIY